MNENWDDVGSDRESADEVLDAMRRAERVDFALRITHSLQGAGRAPRPLALAFQQTVSRVVPPEATTAAHGSAGSDA